MSRHEFFGRNPETYNVDLDAGGDDACDGSGRPGISIVANAIQFWAGQQKRAPSVAECARVFRVPPDAVVEAVNYHPWMTIGGGGASFDGMRIEQDGE